MDRSQLLGCNAMTPLGKFANYSSHSWWVFFQEQVNSQKKFCSKMLAYENFNPEYHYKLQVLHGYKEYFKLEN